MNSLDTFFVPEGQSSQRLDILLKEQFPNHSRTYFQSLIAQGYVLVNGKQMKKRDIPKEGDEVEVCFILPEQIDLSPQDIPLEILYEDDHLLAVNKPAGMVVHPGAGHYKDTFVNALLYHCQGLPFSDEIRPGIVHRLDKDTSGVLIAAKTAQAHQNLVALFASRKVEKKYLAITIGTPNEGVIQAPIARHPVDRKSMCVSFEKGKEATSIVRVLRKEGAFALVEVQILTGRTHQIRVHLQYGNTPILGDIVYGNAKINQKQNVSRQMLHAHEVRIPHPITEKTLHFIAPLPKDMQESMQKNFLF